MINIESFINEYKNVLIVLGSTVIGFGFITMLYKIMRQVIELIKRN